MIQSTVPITVGFTKSQKLVKFSTCMDRNLASKHILKGNTIIYLIVLSETEI